MAWLEAIGRSRFSVGILLLIIAAFSPSYGTFLTAFGCILIGVAEYIDGGRHRLLRRITFGIGFALVPIGIYANIKGY